jgi:biotin carboxyl carrier protein
MKISAQVGDRVFEVEVERTEGSYQVTIDGETREVDAQKLEGDFYSILTEGRSYEVSVEPEGDGYHVRHGAAKQWVSFSDPSRRARKSRSVAKGPLAIVSDMPGRVVRLLVAEGDTVEEGQGVIVVEAMKMENEITTPKAGKVSTVAVEAGQNVERGAELLVVE